MGDESPPNPKDSQKSKKETTQQAGQEDWQHRRMAVSWAGKSPRIGRKDASSFQQRSSTLHADLERKGFMSQLFTTTPLHRFFLQQSRLLHRLLQVIGSSLITRTSHYLQRSSCWWRINQTFSGTFARFSVLERARTVGNKLASVKILVLLSAEIFLR